MNKTVKTVLVAGICVVLLAALGIVSLFAGRISMNPDGTVGNSAGNQNNEAITPPAENTCIFSNLTPPWNPARDRLKVCVPSAGVN